MLLLIFFYNSETVVCQPSPCQNSGTCSVDATSSTGYKCTCSNGYSGVRCENGIYLWIKVFKHKKIFFNFSIKKIKIDVCQNSPCENNGRCTVDSAQSSGFSCSCQRGYTGASCRTSNINKKTYFSS